jgi:hypothetical protein
MVPPTNNAARYHQKSHHVDGMCWYFAGLTGVIITLKNVGKQPVMTLFGTPWEPILVRAVGIEPTLLSEQDFESSASTSSTTPALRLL